MLPCRAPRYAVSQDVVSSLYVERLLDFSVGREKEVDEDDGWDEEGEECICLLSQLDIAAIEVRGPFVDGCIPMRCRIAANARSFAYHYGQTASYGGCRHRYARSSPVLASRPPLSALQGIAALSPQRPNKYARASNLSSKPPHTPFQHRNDAFRLGQPLLWYVRSFPRRVMAKAHRIRSVNPPRERRRRIIRGQIPCAQ